MQAKHGIAVLRIGASALMLTHGWPKLLMLLEGRGGEFPDPLGMGPMLSLVATVGAEFACAALCLVGLYTRLAALPIVFTMGVAAFVVHGDDGWSKQEFPLLYGVAFLALVIGGGGAPSVDLSLRRRNLDEV